MDNTKQLTHISLCTGYGGIDLGLGRVLPSLRTIAYCEIEAFACANLVSKIEAGALDAAPIWTDLKTFPWAQFRGRVDILSGGFPCQPFSSAGRRGGDEDPRHLWPYIIKGIRELGRPPIVFFENVMGIISSKLKGEWADPAGTPVLLHVLRELERLGYRATAGIFSAAEVGAPHLRKRVFILGCRADLIEQAREAIDVGNYTSRNSKGSQWWRGSIETRASISTRKSSDVDYTNGSGWECEGASIHKGRPDMDRRGQSIPSERDASYSYIRASGNAWPASRGKPQHDWEPPRVTSETKPSMGGNPDGTPCRVDYAELCYLVDNRTDELRLLGNGVVPATAERAFRVLSDRIFKSE